MDKLKTSDSKYNLMKKWGNIEKVMTILWMTDFR